MVRGNDKALLNQVVVNEDICKTITTEIANNTTSLIPQPIMIVGQEGSGKTTLLRTLSRADICKDRRKIWIDGRSIFSSEDIISKSLEENASIIFIDDMDFYLTRCNYEEQFRLRRFLYNEGAPMLIGTVSKIVPAMTEYKAPFFEGLKNIFIPPVDIESLDIIFSKEDNSRAQALYRLLPPTIKSVETVYRIMLLSNNPQNDVKWLIDIFSVKFLNSYRNLPANSQHILNAFGSEIAEMTIPELRQATGLPTNILTAYLKNLLSQGIIKADKTIKRNTRYSMKDPLFQKWLSKSEM